ncbi:MAG: hypothetical protein K8I30_16345, partial [Anaerolineae bacterium]|nr:hypothetical protein [Anaerolineae bacterium]
LLTPALEVEVDVQETQGKPVIRIQVPSGEDRPYAIEDNKIYVRDEEETSLAVRDEIVNLVRQRLGMPAPEAATEPDALPTPAPRPLDTGLHPVVTAQPLPSSEMEAIPAPPEETTDKIPPPRAGVEIIGAQTRDDTVYYIMRDLRNGNIVKNVTRSSARRLWHYAIKQRESNPVKPDKIQWHGEIGLWARYEKMGETRYDLVQRDNGDLRVYYGVTENGMHGPWQAFLAPEDEE